MHGIIFQSKTCQKCWSWEPHSSRSTNCSQTYHDLGCVPIILPCRNLSPFLTGQLKSLLKILQFSFGRNDFDGHTSLTWALHPLSNPNSSSNIPWVFPGSGHSPSAICLDLIQHLPRICYSTWDLLQHNIQFMALWILFNFINIKPETLFSKNSFNKYNTKTYADSWKIMSEIQTLATRQWDLMVGGKVFRHTKPSLVAEMLSTICHPIKEDGHHVQLSSHIISCFIINFIADIY